MKRIVGATLWLLLGVSCQDHEDARDDHAGEGAAGHDAERVEHDPWDVHLTEEQARATELATVVAGPGSLDRVLKATAVVGDNLDAQAHVTPRLAGIIRTVHGGLGERVPEGAPLCEIDSIDLGLAVSAALDAAARWRTAGEALGRERVLLERTVEIAEEIHGREKDLAEREISTLRPFYDAERALQEARTNRDRRLLELEAEVEQAAIRRDGALRRLRILGVDPDLLDDEKRSESARAGRYVVRAPREGVIVERDATDSEHVDAEDVIFIIQDLRVVWVQASVHEHDLSKVHPGMAARVHLNAFPDTTFTGPVTFVDYRIDPQARVARVRVELQNEPIPAWQADYPLRPGMFGTVELTLATRAAEVVIPEQAVVHEDDGPRVFVAVEERHFEGRPVRISEPVGGLVEVLSGVLPGEHVVVGGTFTLKSMARAGELGHGHSH